MTEGTPLGECRLRSKARPVFWTDRHLKDTSMSSSLTTFYSIQQEARDGARFLQRDTGTVQIEGRQRAKALREFISREGDFTLAEPIDFGLGPILDVHDQAYIEFLQDSALVLKDVDDPVVADTFQTKGAQWKSPDTFSSRLSRHSSHSGTSIDAGTWKSSYWSAQAAISAISYFLHNRQPAFALCRPAGHHASSSEFGGLCFLNNVAIAATWAMRQGIEKIAILDVDVHHGNGTQEIFYESDRVFTSSVHVDPTKVYPIHSGFAEETGRAKGAGQNVNRPLKIGSGLHEWRCSIKDAIDELCETQPDLVLVSLGFDFLDSDPVSHFRIPVDAVTDIAAIMQARIPDAVFFLEGGYNIEDTCKAMMLFFRRYMAKRR